MRKYLLIAPLLVFPVLAYHLVVLVGSGEIQGKTNGVIFSLQMVSGGQWKFTLGDALLLFGLTMLFAEIVKATSSKSSSLANHGFSTGLLIFCIVEFLLFKSFASSVFFLLMMMTLLDVLAGFMVTIVSARRDFGVGDQIAG